MLYCVHNRGCTVVEGEWHLQLGRRFGGSGMCSLGRHLHNQGGGVWGALSHVLAPVVCHHAMDRATCSPYDKFRSM
jgi:hypothetical protein